MAVGRKVFAVLALLASAAAGSSPRLYVGVMPGVEEGPNLRVTPLPSGPPALAARLSCLDSSISFTAGAAAAAGDTAFFPNCPSRCVTAVRFDPNSGTVAEQWTAGNFSAFGELVIVELVIDAPRLAAYAVWMNVTSLCTLAHHRCMSARVSARLCSPACLGVLLTLRACPAAVDAQTQLVRLSLSADLRTIAGPPQVLKEADGRALVLSMSLALDDDAGRGKPTLTWMATQLDVPAGVTASFLVLDAVSGDALFNATYKRGVAQLALDWMLHRYITLAYVNCSTSSPRSAAFPRRCSSLAVFDPHTGNSTAFGDVLDLDFYGRGAPSNFAVDVASRTVFVQGNASGSAPSWPVAEVDLDSGALRRYRSFEAAGGLLGLEFPLLL
jgi:hypothetical protein